MRMAPFSALGAAGLALMAALQANAPPQPMPTIEQIEVAVALADVRADAVNRPRRP